MIPIPVGGLSLRGHRARTGTSARDSAMTDAPRIEVGETLWVDLLPYRAVLRGGAFSLYVQHVNPEEDSPGWQHVAGWELGASGEWITYRRLHLPSDITRARARGVAIARGSAPVPRATEPGEPGYGRSEDDLRGTATGRGPDHPGRVQIPPPGEHQVLDEQRPNRVRRNMPHTSGIIRRGQL